MSVPGSIVGNPLHAKLMDTAVFFDADSSMLVKFSLAQFKATPDNVDYQPAALVTLLDKDFANLLGTASVFYQTIHYQAVSLQALIEKLDMLSQNKFVDELRNDLTGMQNTLIYAQQAAIEGVSTLSLRIEQDKGRQ